jgi:WD40 repeat protein
MLRVWDVASGSCAGAVEAHAAPVTCLVVSPDGSRAFTGSADRTVREWYLDWVYEF